jgi:hypothetical protein
LIELLQKITEEQISLILRELQAMPEGYKDACLKARKSAAQLRKPTWSIYSMAHINALLLGLSKIKYSESYGVMRLIAVTECYSFAVMGQSGLTFEEFNLVIGPLASVLAPELFSDDQTWAIEPVPEIKYERPFRPISYRGRKAKPKEGDSLDLANLVDTLVKQAEKGQPVGGSMVRVEASTTENPLAAAMMRGSRG